MWKGCVILYFLQNSMASDRSQVTKTLNVENSRWRTAVILQIVKSPSQRKIIRIQWNMVHKCRFGTLWQPDDQIWTFLIFKMADCCRFKNYVFLTITRQPLIWLLIWFQWNFAWGIWVTRIQRSHDTNSKFRQLKKWRTDAILQIIKLPYRNENSSDFDEIWCTTFRTRWESCNQIIWLFSNFKMVDGRYVISRNSAANCPISVKLCEQKQFFS